MAKIIKLRLNSKSAIAKNNLAIAEIEFSDGLNNPAMAKIEFSDR